MTSLAKQDFETMSLEGFFAIDKKLLSKFLKDNNFPKEHTAESIRDAVRDGKVKPSDLALYLSNANNDLFDTPVVGAQVFRSNDGGKTWKIYQEANPDWRPQGDDAVTFNLDGIAYHSYISFRGLRTTKPKANGIFMTYSEKNTDVWQDPVVVVDHIMMITFIGVTLEHHQLMAKRMNGYLN